MERIVYEEYGPKFHPNWDPKYVSLNYSYGRNFYLRDINHIFCCPQKSAWSLMWQREENYLNRQTYLFEEPFCR